MLNLKTLAALAACYAIVLNRTVAAGGVPESYSTPSGDQITSLFEAATRGELENVRLLATRQVVTGTSDAQLMREAEQQVDALARASSIRWTNGAREVAVAQAYGQLAKLKHGVIIYKTQEWKSERLYRIDQATGQDIERLVASTNFDFTDVFTGDIAKNDFHSYSYNYGVRAASLDNRRQALLQPVGLWNAGRVPIGISLLFRTQLARKGSVGRPELDPSKLQSLASASYPLFRLFWRPGTLAEHKVHEFIFSEPVRPEIAIFRLYCDEGNYRRIYRSEVLHGGMLLLVNEAEGFDDHDFPWRWVKTEYSVPVTNAAPTKASTVDFLQVDLAPVFKPGDFAFLPPDEFSITDYSSGTGVVVRLPKVRGVRLTANSLGPQFAVGAAQRPNRSLVRVAMWCVICTNVVLVLALLARQAWRRRTSGHSGNPTQGE